jgi:hypothetical protein
MFDSGVDIMKRPESESLKKGELSGFGDGSRTQFGVMSMLCPGEGVSLSVRAGNEEYVNIEELESSVTSRARLNSAAGLSPKDSSPRGASSRWFLGPLALADGSRLCDPPDVRWFLSEFIPMAESRADVSMLLGRSSSSLCLIGTRGKTRDDFLVGTHGGIGGSVNMPGAPESV